MYCKTITFFKQYFFIWVFFHKHSQFTGQQGTGEVIFLLSTTSTSFTNIQALAGPLMQRAHLYTQVPAELEPVTFGFQVQFTSNQSVRPKLLIILLHQINLYVLELMLHSEYYLMRESNMKNCNVIFIEKKQEYKHYYETKMINRNIFQSKKYYLLMNNKTSEIYLLNTWKSV